MPFQLTFSIEGEKQLSRRLQIMADGISDFTEPFKDTAEYLQDVSSQTFDYQGKNIGVSWPALKESTLRQKAKNYPGAPVLVRTGALRAGFMKSYAMDYAKVWNSVSYFKYHQSNQPRYKLPRRQMLNLSENIKQNIVKYFHSYIQELTSK